MTWTNPSVKGLAQNSDPFETVVARARELVLGAVQEGWEGPPFDPFRLAEVLGIQVVPREDVLDARLVSVGSKPQIEFNPNRSRTRIRFSLAHEIAHTLFPDYLQAVRNRGAHGEARGDEWELELLCNVAASEVLMPTGSAVDPEAPATVETLLNIQDTCDVSLEAAGVRWARSSKAPCTVAVASRRGEGKEDQTYRVDYAIASRSSSLSLRPGTALEGSVFSQCTAVGFTAKGKEPARGELPSLHWECVGIPPFPGMAYPRVLGLCRPAGPGRESPGEVVEVVGDALAPRGTGPRVVAQIVNDKTPNWGGGVSLAARNRFPAAQEDFRRWVAESPRNLALGRTRASEVGGGVHLASMVAQHGYGESTKPRIRYAALRECLGQVRAYAERSGATVHMPKIGTGLSGGNWSIVSELIDEQLVSRGVRVTIYSLPKRGGSGVAGSRKRQAALLEDWSGG
ncbi:MAG: ImmA/IrrE family metallo-endopeptidase [Thermoplasmata archaeon]|nr:ImmA/IrrE family metallo-endopeptidase [Thermoplasmata archaeon]